MPCKRTSATPPGSALRPMACCIARSTAAARAGGVGAVGSGVGASVGVTAGATVAATVGDGVGGFVGTGVDTRIGTLVGWTVGMTVGDGPCVGLAFGAATQLARSVPTP